MKRFKTREEFIKEFGSEWMAKVANTWSTNMNNLLGLPWPCDAMSGWTISKDMLTEDSLPTPLPKEVVNNYLNAGIPLPSSTVDLNKPYMRLMTKEEFMEKYKDKYTVMQDGKIFIVGAEELLNFNGSMNSFFGKTLTLQEWLSKTKVLPEKNPPRYKIKGFNDWSWIEEWFVPCSTERSTTIISASLLQRPLIPEECDTQPTSAIDLLDFFNLPSIYVDPEKHLSL